MLFVPHTTVQLPARAIESHSTRYPEAWLGQMMTVELYSPCLATRLAERPGGILGDWFALGDVPNDPAYFAKRHAIPPRGNARLPSLKHSGVWQLQPGTILNVGRCAPLFGLPGSGCQAEFLDGPLPRAIRTA
jgi:hypothetical protein